MNSRYASRLAFSNIGAAFIGAKCNATFQGYVVFGSTRRAGVLSGPMTCYLTPFSLITAPHVRDRHTKRKDWGDTGIRNEIGR
jgi:hypothetical protein